MLRQVKKAIYTAVLSIVVLLVSSSPVYAQPPRPLSDLGRIVANIVGLLAPAAAIAVLVMLIVGGYQFMTSGGDPKAVAGARNTLTFAVIGVILVVASWLIILLIGNVTGIDLTQIDFEFGN